MKSKLNELSDRAFKLHELMMLDCNESIIDGKIIVHDLKHYAKEMSWSKEKASLAKKELIEKGYYVGK